MRGSDDISGGLKSRHTFHKDLPNKPRKFIHAERSDSWLHAYIPPRVHITATKV